MNKLTGFIMMFAVAALMAVPVSAQTSSEGERERIATPLRLITDNSQNEYKIYEIKHQNAADIAKLIPVDVTISSEFNTLSLDNVPQVHKLVASIIEKYDVSRRTVEFQFFLIRAGNLDEDKQNEGIRDELPEKVLTALNELAGLMRYKNFQLIDAPFLRARDGSNISMSGQGAYNVGRYEIRGIGVRISNEGALRIGSFKSSFYLTTKTANGYPIDIDTALEFAEGETVIVGTSQAGNLEASNTETNSIIVVVTAKIL